MPDLFSSLVYDATYTVFSAGLVLGFSYRTEGRRNVPAKGPALLIANHQSYFDPVLVALATPRRLTFLARQTLFRRPAFAWFIRTLNAVPVDQEGVGVGGLRTILHELQAGQAVLVFPEGHRTADGKMLPLKPGVQLLIKRAQAPVIPIGIAGAYDAWPRWSPLPVPAPIFLPPGKGTLAVAIGKPLDPKPLAELPREDLLLHLANELKTMSERAERLRRKDRWTRELPPAR